MAGFVSWRPAAHEEGRLGYRMYLSSLLSVCPSCSLGPQVSDPLGLGPQSAAVQEKEEGQMPATRRPDSAKGGRLGSCGPSQGPGEEEEL